MVIIYVTFLTVLVVFSALVAEDLGKVYEELYEARVQWKNIGLKLGLTLSTLYSIETHRHYKNEPSCQDMLNEWLTNGKNTNWSTLAEALESPMVGYPNIASAIQTKYCT